jgi:integrase
MKINQLNARELNTLKDGWHLDGKGLHFVVEGTSKHWELLYPRIGGGGKKRQMGLGSYPDVGLADARDKRDAARRLRKQGIDPIDAGKAAGHKQEQDAKKSVTFAQCADEWLDEQWEDWRPDTQRSNEGRLEKHLKPALGHLPVSAIDGPDVVKVVKSIGKGRTPTAEKARADIERIIDFGVFHKYRDPGDNPASRDVLDKRIPNVEEVHHIEHHSSLPYAELPAFMVSLRAMRRGALTATNGGAIFRKHLKSKPWQASISSGKREIHLGMHATKEEAQAAYKIAADKKYGPAETRYMLNALLLEFIILTAVRTRQAILATWGEIDFAKRVWIVPWQRTKTGKKTRAPHVVPLSEQALAVLEKSKTTQIADGNFKPDGFVFVNGRSEAMSGGTGKKAFGRRVSNLSAVQFLRNTVKREDLSVHGFRSTFKEWAEEHDYDNRDSELALDHMLGNRVERAYARKRGAKGKPGWGRIEQRRKLMNDWGDFCVPPDAKDHPAPESKQVQENLNDRTDADPGHDQRRRQHGGSRADLGL